MTKLRSEARRTGSSVALVIFWRIHGEVQQSGLVTPGHDRYGSGLRDRSTDFERSWKLTSIAASEMPLTGSWQSAFCICGFRPSLCGRRHDGRAAHCRTPLRRRVRSRACRKSIDFRTITLSVVSRGSLRRPGRRLDLMTEADADRRPKCPPEVADVALSFTASQRDYVEQVAQALRARGRAASRGTGGNGTRSRPLTVRFTEYLQGRHRDDHGPDGRLAAGGNGGCWCGRRGAWSRPSGKLQVSRHSPSSSSSGRRVGRGPRRRRVPGAQHDGGPVCVACAGETGST